MILRRLFLRMPTLQEAWRIMLCDGFDRQGQRPLRLRGAAKLWGQRPCPPCPSLLASSNGDVSERHRLNGNPCQLDWRIVSVLADRRVGDSGKALTVPRSCDRDGPHVTQHDPLRSESQLGCADPAAAEIFGRFQNCRQCRPKEAQSCPLGPSKQIAAAAQVLNPRLHEVAGHWGKDLTIAGLPGLKSCSWPRKAGPGVIVPPWASLTATVASSAK